MAIQPYHRGRRWSSAYALERIASKRSSADRRLKAIAERGGTFEVERSQLLSLVGQLDVEEREEQRRIAARRRARPNFPDATDLPAIDASGAGAAMSQDAPSKPAAPGSEPVARSAAQAAGAAPHDGERCLFVTARGPVAGSTRPKRVDVGRPGFEEPLLRRAVEMLETPGLIHKMVLAERSQVVVDLASIRVPDLALGLPLADAYRGHVFSSDALTALSNPEKAASLLAKITGDGFASEPA